VPRDSTLRVNHPIDVDGTLYYQASYGFGMRFALTHHGKAVRELSNRVLMEGDTLQIPGTQRSLQYAQFVPTLDRQTGSPSADPRVNNPAAVVNVFDAGAPLGAALVPLHSGIDLGGGWRVTPAQYVIYSGLQYRHDPGTVLVGIGAFVLLAGLVISFYLLPARLVVRVEERPGGGSTVGVAATTVKGYDIYEREFGALVTELKGAIA
jgi:cytochrome c biogenesis protein